MTWVLLLYLGFTDPVKIEGYRGQTACERAGANAIAKIPTCQNGTRRCGAFCIQGP